MSSQEEFKSFGHFFLAIIESKLLVRSISKYVLHLGIAWMHLSARSLTPQDLADTLCGSPLYMAPEIIQNQKYDAKVIECESDIIDRLVGIFAIFFVIFNLTLWSLQADLWSVGAILFQLVTGKPPFDGNCQLQVSGNLNFFFLSCKDLAFS